MSKAHWISLKLGSRVFDLMRKQQRVWDVASENQFWRLRGVVFWAQSDACVTLCFEAL